MDNQPPGAPRKQPRWSSEREPDVVVGRMVQPPPENVEPSAAPPDEPLGKFGRNKPAVLLTIFLAAGILGLPLLLLSPAFSKIEKGLWTVVILIYTVAIFYVLYLMIQWTLRSLNAAGIGFF